MTFTYLMARDYYYLVAGLPDILLDGGGECPPYAGFVPEVMEQVSEDDAGLFRWLRLPHDNRNLITLLEGKDREFDGSGNYSEEELRYEIETLDTIPRYMQVLIEAYRASTPLYQNITWEDQLNWLFYEETERIGNIFLREWFEFELNLKNLLVAVNCRRYGIPLEKRLTARMEQPEAQCLVGRNEVAETIIGSNAPDFSITPLFPWVERVLSFDHTDPLSLEKDLDELRWEVLDEMTMFCYFQVETLLAFSVKLGITDRWRRLRPEVGGEMFNRLVADLEGGLKFPEEISVVGRRK